jgi:hypothetical protein
LRHVRGSPGGSREEEMVANLEERGMSPDPGGGWKAVAVQLQDALSREMLAASYTAVLTVLFFLFLSPRPFLVPRLLAPSLDIIVPRLLAASLDITVPRLLPPSLDITENSGGFVFA